MNGEDTSQLAKMLKGLGASKETVLQSLINAHIQIEVGALLTARHNIESFAGFYLEHPKGPPLNVLWDAVIEFAMRAVIGGNASHFRLHAQHLGYDLDRQDDELAGIMRKTREDQAYIAAKLLEHAGVTFSEARKFLNDEGPYAQYLRQEE